MRWIGLIACVAATLIAACDGSPTALESCKTIPDLSLHVGEEDSIKPCFQGTGSELTYSAESSDPKIVEARAEDDGIFLLARSPGEAIITVKATSGNSIGEISFLVGVSNRDPVLLDRPETLRVLSGRTTLFVLTKLFSDPDGQKMTFTVVKDSDLVETEIAGDTLKVTGIRGGRSLLQIRGSDGFSSISAEIPLRVLPRIDVHVNDFNSLRGWIRASTTATTDSGMKLSGGNLEVWSRHPQKRGAALKPAVIATDWEAFARMRPGEDGTDVVFVIRVNGENSHIEIRVGNGTNDDFSVHIFDASVRRYREIISGDFGLKSIHDYVDTRIWYENGEYHLSFNGDEPRAFGRDLAHNETTLIALAAHSTHRNIPEKKVYLDSVHVSGFSEDGSDLVTNPITIDSQWQILPNERKKE